MMKVTGAIIEIELSYVSEGRIHRKALGAKLYEAENENQQVFLLKELFRSVLRETYDDRYRLDIIKRPEAPSGLPH